MSLHVWMRLSLVALLATGTTMGLACGDDDGGGASNEDGGAEPHAGSGGGGSGAEPGMMTSVEITAADGGEVALGDVTLSIPAGALDEDTEVTVEVLDKADQPDADTIVADVYDFGPDGTEFSKPVTLEFDVAGLDVPSGKSAMVAFLDGDAWTTLDDSELSGGKITATTTHFTPFTVVLVLNPDGGATQVGGACPTEDFDACGGDLTGTWTYSGACATFPPEALGGSGDNPFAMCTDQPQIAVTVDIQGTSTFGDDGSFTLDQTLDTSIQFTVPESCVTELTMGMGDPGMACEQILMGTLNADGACESAPMGDSQTNMETGTWTADSATGTLMIESTPSDGGTADAGTGAKNEDIKYCVRGDEVTVVVHDLDNGFTIRYTATRQ